jgi:hypothetical protein
MPEPRHRQFERLIHALERAFDAPGLPIDYHLSLEGGSAELWEIDHEDTVYGRLTYRVSGYADEREALLALAAKIVEVRRMDRAGLSDEAIALGCPEHPAPLSEEEFWRHFGEELER